VRFWESSAFDDRLRAAAEREGFVTP